MSLWLTPEELIELTGYKRRSAQRQALAQMNLRFMSRPIDGFPLVPRWQFEGEIARPDKRRRIAPDYESLKR